MLCMCDVLPKGETGREEEREVLCVWKRKETDQYWLPLLGLTLLMGHVPLPKN